MFETLFWLPEALIWLGLAFIVLAILCVVVKLLWLPLAVVVAGVVVWCLACQGCGGRTSLLMLEGEAPDAATADVGSVDAEGGAEAGSDAPPDGRVIELPADRCGPGQIRIVEDCGVRVWGFRCQVSDEPWRSPCVALDRFIAESCEACHE